MLAEQQELFDELVCPERFARKPRFMKGKEDYQVIRPFSHAPKYPYIQTQSPTKAFRIVLDIDRNIADLARSMGFAQALNVPTPNLALINPENGHAHLFFELSTPIALYDGARQEPMRYLAAVEHGLVAAFDADRGYAGYICKNPYNPSWELIPGRLQPYSLAELFEYEPKKKEDSEDEEKPQSEDYDNGFRRNCKLFDRLRLWSYRAINKSRDSGFEAWKQQVYQKACCFNVFAVQLEASEIRAIAKSVAKWTWNRLGADERSRKAFSETQKVRQKRAATKRRTVTTADVITAKAQLSSAGKRVSMSAVAKLIGCSQPNLSKHYRDLF